MWADDSQRDRIFEMIGAHAATPVPVHSARGEHWHAFALALVAIAVLGWIALAIR